MGGGGVDESLLQMYFKAKLLVYEHLRGLAEYDPQHFYSYRQSGHPLYTHLIIILDIIY